jgi:regulation of enolase protein 1 (concanavalin A-like superfamily)
MIWLNEPPSWSEQDGVLTVQSDEDTDFWRKTHYGFVHDNGHVYGREVEGDFTATVTFAAEYEAQYDHAGLMLRLDEENWIKAGIELADGRLFLSAVVTRDFSDWSVLPLTTLPKEMRLRVTRNRDTVLVQYALEEGDFQMLRLAHLQVGGTAFVGQMCCSPKRAGLAARFWNFEIGDPGPDLNE